MSKGSHIFGSVPRPNRDARRTSRRNTCAVMKASPVAVWRSCGMTPNISHSASSVKWRIAGRPAKRAVALEVQREVHRVEAAVEQRRAPVPFVGGVERPHVVADVVADDHAVLQVVEEPLQRGRLVHPVAALVARHAVHGDRARVLGSTLSRAENESSIRISPPSTATAPMVMMRSVRGIEAGRLRDRGRRTARRSIGVSSVHVGSKQPR